MKRLFAILLALCLLLSLTACGGSADEHTKKPTGTTSGKNPTTTVTTPGNENCEHTFAENAWLVIQTSTCKEQGYQERTCQKCTYTERQELPLGEHVYTAGVCSGCGDVIPASQGLMFTTEYNKYSYVWVAYLVGMGECTDTRVVVPATYSDYPVSGIGTLFRFGSDVTEVTFLSPIYDMPSYLFANHAALEKITFAEGQTNIWDGTFFDASALKEVVLPSTLTGIGESAFAGSSLETISIPGGVQVLSEKLFDGCSALKTVVLSEGLLSINERAFQNCTALETIQLPNTLKSIDGYAFYGCTSLTSIAFPDEVTILPSFVCARAQNLKTVTIGDKVTRINICAFQNCFQLESITLPATLKNIGKSAFSGCMKLSTIIFEGTVEQWHQITKEENWNNYCPASVVQCIDGEVPLA